MQKSNFIPKSNNNDYIASIKDVWQFNLEDKYINNPDLIDLAGIRIVIWNFSSKNINKLLHRSNPTRHNPFAQDLQINKCINHNSYIMKFSEKEIEKRSKTIQINSKKIIDNFPVVYHHNTLINDLINLNKKEVEEFSYHYKIQMGQKLKYNQFKIDKSYEGRDIILTLVVIIQYEDESLNFQIFPNSIRTTICDENFFKYLMMDTRKMYCSVASYVDGIEIFEKKEFQKYRSIVDLLYEWCDKNNIKDMMIDNTEFVSKLIDYGIDPNFLANFTPNKSCIEFQPIPIDIEKHNILGPIYVTRNIY